MNGHRGEPRIRPPGRVRSLGFHPAKHNMITSTFNNKKNHGLHICLGPWVQQNDLCVMRINSKSIDINTSFSK